jgi:hypothetical protein
MRVAADAPRASPWRPSRFGLSSVPLVVFQFAYEYTGGDLGESLSGGTTITSPARTTTNASTIMVGAAFGF